jgi:hypothetical protein
MGWTTLADTIEKASILTDKMPKTVIVDRGYQGVVVDGVQILRSGQRRGITRGLKVMIKRRSPIDPTIGHMKMDGPIGSESIERSVGGCVACRTLRCRPQHPAPDEEAAASLARNYGLA